MATPRRSSARLQSRTPQNRGSTLPSPLKLTSLVERDETPERGVQPTLNFIAASAPAKVASAAALDGNSITPTAPRIRPSQKEMHPSRHHSTAKKLLRTGIADNARASALSPSLSQAKQVDHDTGTVQASSTDNPFSSPNFEFRYTRPSTDLSSEAQRMMDEVREQAAKIKAELAGQHTDREGQGGLETASSRKMVSAKGKIGRFSDIHMEQFKKMNSIADHPSSFRADASRSSPMTKSLKRTNSKAGLDKADTEPEEPSSAGPERKVTQRVIASPVKRLKGDSRVPRSPSMRGDASGVAVQKNIATATVGSALGTPTKASLARSASTKSMKTGKSMIPSLTRSPSTKTLATPQALRTVHVNTEGKVRSAFASKLMSVKSILRRPQPKFSDDPVKLAAGTHISTPVTESQKPSGEVSVETPGSPSHRKEKHVNFSSSPDKLIPSSPVQSPHSPTQTVQYPTLPTSLDDVTSPTQAKWVPKKSTTGPADFTFRADKTIRFAPQNATKATIRHVSGNDQSDMPVAQKEKFPALPAVPHGLSNKKRKHESPNDHDKENEDSMDKQQSPAKKARFMPSLQPSPSKTPTGKLKTPTKLGNPGSKRRGMLSLSRLNALARPKQRRS